MSAQFKNNFNQRFRMRVLMPGALILLVTAMLCGGALIAAGRGTDTMSLLGQQSEIYRAIAAGLDDLTLAQESVGLCDACIHEAASADADPAWLDENVAFRMFDLHNVHETYILDEEDRPIYASVRRERTSPAAFERVAPAVDRFVALARGEIKRPSGRGNLNERLPNSPPAPITLPPMPGFADERPTWCASAIGWPSSARCRWPGSTRAGRTPRIARRCSSACATWTTTSCSRYPGSTI
jgi:hypothetical protein